MKTIKKIIIQWDDYKPSSKMQRAIDQLNQYSLRNVRERLPLSLLHASSRVSFSYRIYSNYPLNEVKKVYIIVSGFAERADMIDAGVKGLLVDMLVNQIETQTYAIIVISGLLSFPVTERKKFTKRGHGALLTTAEEMANLVKSKFRSIQTATVSGYSLGGVMTPLVARAIIKQKVAIVNQVCSGEPTYSEQPTTIVELLKRTSKASAYRNEQITATAIESYIAVKKTPESRLAMIIYRARLYRPLVPRMPSMRFVARELAQQAVHYTPATKDFQLEDALLYLAKQRVPINLLHAEHSVLCQGQAFFHLVDKLTRVDGVKLQLIIIKGTRADHGIEEQRSLSSPFLVMPELYESTA